MKIIKYHYLNRSPQKEKNFPDKWNLAKSASILLSFLANCTDQRTINFVFEFIKENSNNENSKTKESFLMAYGSVLDCIYTENIKQIIEGSIPTLIQMLTDKSFDVRTTVSWVIKKICKYHTDRIDAMKNSNIVLLDNFIQTIIKNLNSNKKVVINLMESINNICSNLTKLSEETFQSNILSNYYKLIIDSLLEVAYMPEAISTEIQIANNAFYTISNLVESAPSDVLVLVQSYFSNFIDLLLATKNKSNFQNEEHRMYYQDYICSLISSYLIYEKITLNMDQAKFLYEEVKAFFLERGTVFENGISLCTSIALNIGKQFKEFIQDFGNFLYHALGMWNSEIICKAAIMSVSDLIRSMGSDFDPYIDQIIQMIFNIIQV